MGSEIEKSSPVSLVLFTPYHPFIDLGSSISCSMWVTCEGRVHEISGEPLSCTRCFLLLDDKGYLINQLGCGEGSEKCIRRNKERVWTRNQNMTTGEKLVLKEELMREKYFL
ncbi:hypothetical protein CDAR_114051 [Caerostris darwini]|uniref:LAGLIDADG homing endonuclease n=1 Tax=Caerostris darwini TaxID=1538125 RepID=A0AAV4RUU4_9ARAC|nr:hypothetical protein CDAR_114051 [Caerostris darwini]